jgi:hypothetical protein
MCYYFNDPTTGIKREAFVRLGGFHLRFRMTYERSIITLTFFTKTRTLNLLQNFSHFRPISSRVVQTDRASEPTISLIPSVLRILLFCDKLAPALQFMMRSMREVRRCLPNEAVFPISRLVVTCGCDLSTDHAL